MLDQGKGITPLCEVPEEGAIVKKVCSLFFAFDTLSCILKSAIKS